MFALLTFFGIIASEKVFKKIEHDDLGIFIVFKEQLRFSELFTVNGKGFAAVSSPHYCYVNINGDISRHMKKIL